MTTILADAINLGLTKMAESCPGTSYAKLSWLQAWHIRDETYATGLAELVNAQLRQPFAENWGDGTTSSSDGQRFKTGGKAESTGHINPKYGAEPGKLFYTHISDQYAPFSSKVVNVGVRDSTYVLDGLLHHESDLRIEEHYTDTAGFTDHVFPLMHLLGFRFAQANEALLRGRPAEAVPPGELCRPLPHTFPTEQSCFRSATNSKRSRGGRRSANGIPDTTRSETAAGEISSSQAVCPGSRQSDKCLPGRSSLPLCYIHFYSGNAELVAESLEVIQRTSALIFSATETPPPPWSRPRPNPNRI